MDRILGNLQNAAAIAQSWTTPATLGHLAHVHETLDAKITGLEAKITQEPEGNGWGIWLFLFLMLLAPAVYFVKLQERHWKKAIAFLQNRGKPAEPNVPEKPAKTVREQIQETLRELRESQPEPEPQFFNLGPCLCASWEDPSKKQNADRWFWDESSVISMVQNGDKSTQEPEFKGTRSPAATGLKEQPRQRGLGEEFDDVAPQTKSVTWNYSDKHISKAEDLRNEPVMAAPALRRGSKESVETNPATTG
jgi:hypothetical protein